MAAYTENPFDVVALCSNEVLFRHLGMIQYARLDKGLKESQAHGRLYRQQLIKDATPCCRNLNLPLGGPHYVCQLLHGLYSKSNLVLDFNKLRFEAASPAERLHLEAREVHKNVCTVGAHVALRNNFQLGTPTYEDLTGKIN
jgi:hypothetical protein